MAGESSIGSLIGGGLGAAAGSTLLPGLGTVGGAKLGAGLGGAVGGLFGANKAQGKVEESQPLAQDPNQISRLREIDATRKQIAQGSDPLLRSRVNEIQRLGETTKGQIVKNTGGDVGGTVTALLRAQRNIGQGVNTAFNQSQARLPFFENLSSQLSNRISQRKLELGIRDQNQFRGEQAQQQTFANNAISGVVGTLPSLFGGGNTDGANGSQQVPGLSTQGINSNLNGIFRSGITNNNVNIGGGGNNSLGNFQPPLFNPDLQGTFQSGISN